MTTGIIVRNFIKNGVTIPDHPFELPDLPDSLNEKCVCFVHMKCQALESLVKSDVNKMLVALFPEHVLRSIEKQMRISNGKDFKILQAGVKVLVHTIYKVLAEVKDKLLEFMMALDKQFGVNTEINDLKKNQSIINQIMNTTIHNNGDGNVSTPEKGYG